MEHTAEWLGIVAKQHDKWVSIVKMFGETEYADDIVQNAYLALYKYTTPEKVIRNDKVSDGYMYFTLKSIFLQYQNQKNKIHKVRIDDESFFEVIPDDNTSIEEQKAFHKICMLVDEEMANWTWYNRKLTEIYRDTDMSIRKIAAETKISFVSIFNTLKNCKNQLKIKLHEEFEDYQNGEYERIKPPKK